MAIKSMDLVWISVSDIKNAQKFFTETLGLKELNFAPEYGWLEVQGKNGGISLGIGQASPDHADSKPGINGIMTLTVDNIEETMKDLKAKGVTFVDEIVEVPGHVKMVSFVDADGNLFQLCEQLNAAPKKCSTSCC